jgi:CheY-like chemotaxis protein
VERLHSMEFSQRSPTRLADHHGRARVLLLDDDEASLRLMHGVLRTAGYECVVAHHAGEALDAIAQQNKIDVVVSDICMPDIDGLMFLDRLRELHTSTPLPQVLFLTGHPSIDNAVAAMRRGAVDFLMKPLRPRELLEAVDRACERAAQTVSIVATNLTVENLANQAEQLASRLRMLTPGQTTEARSVAPQAKSLGDVETPLARQYRSEQLLDTMEQLRRLRRRYHEVLGELDDVAWDLLVETLRSHRAGKQISVSGLSISLDGVSSTTALRRINELVARGHLRRLPDPSDARRDFIVLEAKTRDALDDYLARVALQLDQAAQASDP